MGAYDVFASFYDEWSAHMTEDVAFYVELAREANGPVVELAVGNGRVAIPVAIETGKRVIGIDLSAGMLAQARERAEGVGAELELRQADMRDFELEERAALVYCPFRSLLHLPTWADRRRTFERVAAALAPGGRFAWNAFAFDPLAAARTHGEEQPHAEGSEIRQIVTHHPSDNRIDVEAWKGSERFTTSIWWLTRSEWEGLIDVAGFEVEALYGWFDRRPFAADSREFVWIVRKP